MMYILKRKMTLNNDLKEKLLWAWQLDHITCQLRQVTRDTLLWVGQLDHVPHPLGHVCRVLLHVEQPGVAHQGHQVRPLAGVLPQANVHKVAKLRGENPRRKEVIYIKI